MDASLLSRLNAQKVNILKKVSLFSGMKDAELQVVASNSDFFTYDPGETVVKEGDVPDGICIVVKGGVLITRDRDGETIDLARIVPGESFGEFEMLQDSPMTASARAEDKSILLVFPVGNLPLSDVLARRPDVSAQILHKFLITIAGRIRSTNRLLSEKSYWVEDLKRQLMNDKLTGLYNRTYLLEEFPTKLMNSKVTGLLMIKPDNFKQINDTYGHDGGDKALLLLADMLRSLIGKDDVAIRYRGDEYAVVLQEQKLSKAVELGEILLNAVKNINLDGITGGTKMRLTASVGVAFYPDHAVQARELVDICFKKMFEARENGGDRICAAGL